MEAGTLRVRRRPISRRGNRAAPGLRCQPRADPENENGQPLNVGRKTRSDLRRRLRRALNSRDQGCRFPGCTHKHYVDGHHIEHWAHGGETKLATSSRSAASIIDSSTKAASRVEILDDGAIRFVQPDGECIDSVSLNHTRPLGDWRRLPAAHKRAGIRINATTAATRWDGGLMDYGMAMDSLMSCR